jgi:hypothetical protein
MDKNQNTWSHRTKILFHPLGSLAGLSARFIVLWQENVRGTRKASLAGDRYNLLWMWFLNVWDNVPMDLKYVCQQYFTCMRFLGFIRYNSEHRKMRAKQQHVCKEMYQYMINTNRKWILSFGIEWTYGVKYRKRNSLLIWIKK